ncbi:MAG: L-fucose:H+ symporter permease [Dysgonamonadaceae bacterium]|jgi:FHS family L-fucose permease-like MFS transporter|nr:L-fucose:H+ symporter permease [Dysgonamonadaceae bacterium]
MNNKSKFHLITPGYVFTFALVSLLFFLWALPNTMNDVLIQQFMKSMELSRLKAGLVQSAFKLGYFAFAIPAGLYMQRFGYKKGLMTGLVLFACGCFLFWPAALAGKYAFFLGALFVIASGLSFLELGANSFITGLGDAATSERRLNFAQSFNPIGSIVGVTVGTVFIFSGNEPTNEKIVAMKAAGTYQTFLNEETMRIGPPYIAIGVIVLLVALIIWRTRFPKVEPSGSSEHKGSFKELRQYPHWYSAIIAQFFYLGAQLGTWSYLITYVKENSALTEKEAGGLLIVNMVAFMCGRFFSTYLMKYVKPAGLMGVYALINIGLVSIGILASSWAGFSYISSWFGIGALICSSFFMSLMYPTIFASGVKGLGPNTKMGASALIMSVIGGAALTPVMGLIADKTGAVAPSYIVPIISYSVITWFAFFGSRPRGPLYDVSSAKN